MFLRLLVVVVFLCVDTSFASYSLSTDLFETIEQQKEELKSLIQKNRDLCKDCATLNQKIKEQTGKIEMQKKIEEEQLQKMNRLNVFIKAYKNTIKDYEEEVIRLHGQLAHYTNIIGFFQRQLEVQRAEILRLRQ